MAINAYTRAVPIRESQNTYVPLPFEEMYRTLQYKQELYDKADAYEREQKKEISKLSSPIAAHNDYLVRYKNKYLEDAKALHNSIPDKGSALYRRKLQDLVDGYVSDPNRVLIDESNAAWAERTKIVTKQMSEGKYSKAADLPYLSFTGANPDGSLKKFVFAGIREKKDWKKLIDETIKSVPEQRSSRDVTDKETGRRVKVDVKSKSASAIANSLNTVLGMDSEALQDMQVDLNITDPKEFSKYINALAVNNAKYDTERVDDWNASLVARQDAKIKEQEELQFAYNMGTYQDAGHKKMLEKLNSYVDEKGNLKPSSSAIEGFFSFFGGPGSLPSTPSESKEQQLKNSKKEILAIPEIKNVYNNFKAQNMSDDDALRASINFYRQRGDAQQYQGRMITNAQERTSVEGIIAGNLGMLDFYDKDNPDFAQPLTLAEENRNNRTTFVKDGKIKEINVGAELAPSRFGNKAYTVTIGDKQYIAAFNSQNPRDMQSKLLFEMQRNPAPTKLRYFMPDPSHPELGDMPRENVILLMGPDGKLHLKDDPNP